jgi:hypothetical protein
MFRKIPILMGRLLLCLFVFGCVAPGTITKPVEPVQEEGLVISPPDRIIQDVSAQPAHVKFVLAAMVNKMRGNRDDIAEAVFRADGKHAFYDPDFSYDDFALNLTEITGFELRNRTEYQAQLVIEGVCHFEDLFGRHVANYFVADYSIQKDGVTIHKSATALIAPAILNIETYFVPQSSFDGINMNDLSSFMDLYLHAALNAFKMEPTQAEREKREAYEKMSLWKKMVAGENAEAEAYYIMAFCKDRLPPEASLEMKITDKPRNEGNPLFETGYIYDQGWRVMIAGGCFVPDVLRNNFYINLQYSTNPETNPNTICVGSYTNQKNYKNAPKFIIKQKEAPKRSSLDQPKLNPDPPKLNPIESGTVFLNPANKDDARLIQTRLAGLGYYNKKIDGDFGPGSMEALKNFKKDKQMGNNGNWDLKTQKMLFENSGL